MQPPANNVKELYLNVKLIKQFNALPFQHCKDTTGKC
jgi:hypothetical protein